MPTRAEKLEAFKRATQGGISGGRAAQLAAFKESQAASPEQQRAQKAEEVQATLAEYTPDVGATGAGFVESFQRPIYGALDYFDIDDPEASGVASILSKAKRQEAMRTMRERKEESPISGGVGGFTGEMSQLALPGAMLSKAARGGAALPYIADIGTAGLRGAAITPEDEEGSRTMGALTEGGAAVAGLGIGKAVEKFAKGARKMPGVQEYIDKGGYLTPGQAAESRLIRGLETVGTVTPFTAKGVKEMQERAVEGVSKQFIDDVAKQLEYTGDIPGGQQGIAKLTKLIGDKYDEAWGTVDTKVWENTQRKLGNKLIREGADWSADQANVLKRLGNDAKRVGVKKFDTKMRNAIDSAKKDYAFQQHLKDVRRDMRDMVAGPETKRLLKEVDSVYPDFLTVQDAAGRVAGGRFTGSDIAKSSRRIGGLTRSARGEAPMQKATEDIAAALQSEASGAPLDFFRRVARMAPTPVPREVMRKLGQGVTGDTTVQKWLAKVLEENPELIQRAGAIGAAYEG
jgi:hypothetical protein